MHPCCSKYLICSGEPPSVALEMDQAASFLISTSAVARRCTSGGMTFASMTAWICSRVPAVMFEIALHASLLMPFLGELSCTEHKGSWGKGGRGRAEVSTGVARIVGRGGGTGLSAQGDDAGVHGAVAAREEGRRWPIPCRAVRTG